METWLKISLLLCSFGFFREMRPSEPYVIEFLSDWLNLTSAELSKDVYPLGIYAVLVQLVIIFLVTDILRYKPIIVISGIAGTVLLALPICIRTVLSIQKAQVFFGTLMASEVAYYTYIYAKVKKEHYQIVTGHTPAAILCGKFLGGVLGQVLISTGSTDILALFHVSLGSQVVSLCIAIALLSVSKSLYFYTDQQKIDRTDSGQEKNDKPDSGQYDIVHINLNMPAITTQTAAKPKFSWRNAMLLLWEHTVSAYSQPVVVKWSIWWALATSAQAQVIAYAQFLWKEIDPNHENFYNGDVEATVTLLGAGGSMAACFMNSSRHKHLHWRILIICSFIMSVLLIVSAVTNSVIVSYVMYILFGMFYYFVITIASATVAEHLKADSFGLIFGINTLAALVLQTLLTVFVITDAGLGYGPRGQYIVYGWYCVALACFYGTALLLKFVYKHGHKAKYVLE